LRNPNPLHASCLRRLKTQIGILKNQATLGSNFKSLGCDEKRLRVGFTVPVVFGSDESLKTVQKFQEL
jgi:hypothetical protein